MESPQIMELLLAMREGRKTAREKSDANMKAMQARMDARQARMDAWQARMDANHEKRMARMDAWLTDIRNDRKQTMACLEKTEARLEVEDKPASVDMTPEVAHEQEVPVEDAEVTPVGEPRKRRRDRRHLAAVHRQKKKDQNLDAECRRKEQERAQRKDGCRRNVVAASRGANHSARRRILLTKDTTREYCGFRKGSAAARRGTTRRVQVARRNFLSTKDTTREHRESRKDLAATGRGETCREKVAWRSKDKPSKKQA
jgi:hypothetical protein